METLTSVRRPNASVRSRRVAAHLVAVAALLCLVTLVPAVYVFHAALPYNPVQLPGGRSAELRVIAPQGWKFFTRDPREERLLVRVPDGAGGWTSDVTPTNSAPQNLFGALRSARAQPSEMSELLLRVPETEWVACTADPNVCLAAFTRPLVLNNPDPTPTLCGDVGFVMQPPIPWAWARRLGAVILNSKVLRTQVSCS
jgi:antimicrobial peptide system SdpA family protein